MNNNQEHGPCYGVPLIKTLPLNGGMKQALPTRSDLVKVRKYSERTVAGYEVLLDHYQEAMKVIEKLKSELNE